MAKTKQMNENAFAKLLKDMGSAGEHILSLQKEKQAVIDSFESEKGRYKSGKISEATLSASTKKANKELASLDKKIREAIKKVGKVAASSREFASRQSPKHVRVAVSGVKASSSSKKKSSSSKKKQSKRLTPKLKKAEMNLDKKYQHVR